MQGIGVLLAIVGYGVTFAAYQQAFGPGGSTLFWLTGNPNLGQPTPAGSSVSHQGQVATSASQTAGQGYVTGARNPSGQTGAGGNFP